jgi:trehalose 6-phosphate synthase/phosphatase
VAGSGALNQSDTGSPGAGIVEALAERARAAAALLLVLDYDGTLVPFAMAPELAGPDDEVITLLRDLAGRPRTEVHVVSGRPRETLERWLGRLPIGLHAEHGLSSRFPSTGAWIAPALPSQEWRAAVLELMRAFSERTPGAFIEDKSIGLAWHYRAADPALGAVRARALELELSLLLDDRSARVLPGAKVVEVVAMGVHKGRLVRPLLARAPAEALLVAIGDDRTDEDLFAALPAEALASHVGPGPSRASIRLAGVPEVRALLHAIVQARPA